MSFDFDIRRYVWGLPFTNENEMVSLVRKKRDERTGLLGGLCCIGGLAGHGETFDKAIIRRGREEAELECEWTHFCTLSGVTHENREYVLHVYRAQVTVLAHANDLGDRFEWVRVSDVNDSIAGRGVLSLPELHWLVPMACTRSPKWPYNVVEGV